MLRYVWTYFSHHALRWLLVLWFGIVIPSASANHPIIQGFNPRVAAEVTLPNTEYREATVDLRVKVRGGELALTRTWVNSQWIINPSWATLRFQGQGSDGRPLQINRAGMLYRADHQAGHYRAGSSTLRQTDTGWYWQDKLGNWIRYDPAGRITQYGDKNITLAQFVLDEAGRRLAVQDHHGQVIYRFQYDEQERLVSVVDLSGRTVSYQWQGNQLRAVTDVDGHHWGYEYDTWGQLVQRSDPDGGVFTLQYANPVIAPRTAMLSGKEATGKSEPLASNDRNVVSTQQVARVSEIRDKSGAKTVWQRHVIRQHGGWRVEKTGPDGGVERRDFDQQGRLTLLAINGQVKTRWTRPDAQTQEVTEERGEVTRLRYDSAQRLQHMRFADGKQATFQYDPRNGRLSSYQDRAGIVTEFSYDSHGNLLTVTLAAGTPERYRLGWHYDALGQPTVMTEGEGESARQSTASYDQQGNLLSLTQEGQRQYQFQYNVQGQVTAITDPLGKVWRYGYSASGLLQQATDPLQQHTTYHYDALSRITAITDPLGQQSTYHWQTRALGYRLQLTDALGKAWHYDFDALERLINTTSPQGLRTTLDFDRDGRLSQFTEPSGDMHRVEYGAPGTPEQGRVVSQTTPVNQERYQYTLLGLPASVSVLPNLVQRIHYNAQDLPAIFEDTAGRKAVSEYNALGALTRYIDRLGGETRYRYHPGGELAAVTTPAGREFTFDQDRLGEVVAESRPTGNRYQYQYDPAGQLIAQHDALGNRLTYRYDAVGQLIEAQYFAPLHPDPEQTVQYRYDAAGNLTAVTQRGKTESQFEYTYDALGQRLSESIRYGEAQTGIRTQLQYRYTADGQRQSMTYPDNSLVEFQWQADRLQNIILPNGQRERRESWQWYQPTTIHRPGSVQTLRFDALMRPEAMTLKVDERPLDQQQYQYDTAGNMTEHTRNGQVTRYSYDAEDQLILQRSPLGVVQRLRYDAEGHRTFTSASPSPWQYNDKQQLVTRGSGADQVQYRWDLAGNLVQEIRDGITIRYQYNAANQLVTVWHNDAVRADYQYDPFGRRIGKRVDGVQHWFVYSPEGLVAQLDRNGQMQHAWGWEPNTIYGSKPLWQAQLTSAGTLKSARYAWLITDSTGTPLIALDDQGKPLWKGTRDAFAAVVPAADSQITVNLRYAGQYADAETGLYYNGFRYYDPLTGRYLQPDPLGLSGGLNSYTYALNNPLRYIDPEGQHPVAILLIWTARFAVGWAIGEAMDYLIGYLPDNECNPLLSLQRWANAASYAVAISSAQKGVKALTAAVKLRRGLGGAGKGTSTVDVLPNPYGITQSRINMMKGSQASGSGWNHVIHEHYSGKLGKSQFTLPQSELQSILQTPQVVKSPIKGTLSSTKGDRYIREVDIGRPIGTDKFNNHQPTSIMTILTDKHGNLITVTPGRIK